MGTTTRPTAPTRSFMSSTMNSGVKENRPAWYGGCSPGRPNSFMRAGGMKPLGEHKPGNVKTTIEGRAPKNEKPVVKKNPSPLRTAAAAATGAKVLKPASPRVRPASPRPSASAALSGDLKTATGLVTSRPKVVKGPVKNETPPPTRPKKPLSSVVTPTNKGRKPLATIGTPTNQGIRDRSRSLDETPTRKVKERPNSPGVPQDANKAKDKGQPFSAWGYNAGKPRRGSTPGKGTTPNRAPVKSMFLSPQASKKIVKKEPLRKSAENHGIWIGQVPTSRKRGVGKREADGEMPAAQPTNSPEIPKRGSREMSGEGARGYFGAGPMVAPEGCGGLVRDRRKCKPRGTLNVGNEGLSIDSDSSGVLEMSIQMPLPSVALVEWMDRENTPGEGNDLSHNSAPGYCNDDHQSRGGSRLSQELTGDEFLHRLKQARSSGGEKTHTRDSRQYDEYQEKSLHDLYSDGFYQQFRQTRSSAGEAYKQEVRQSRQSADGYYKNRASQEVYGDGFYQQLKYARSSGGEAFKPVRQSRQSGEGFYQPIVRSSQAFLQLLRQSQHTSKEGMGQVSRVSMQSTHSEGIIRNTLQGDSREFPGSAGYGDVTIDWREGLPDESEASSTRQSPDDGRGAEFVEGSISFGSSWVPPAQERRISGSAKTWYAPDSSWYGFSPITPDFHRASQLTEGGGSKLIDALVAGSVRRRIITEHRTSDEDADLPNKSLIQSLQAINVDSSLNRSATSRSSLVRSPRGSQDAQSVPFSFSTRRSYANIAELEEQGHEPMDNHMCQTASPIEPLLTKDLICQGARTSLHADDFICMTASPLHSDSMICQTGSPLHSDDPMCQTSSPRNEVSSAPPLSMDGSKWSEVATGENGWDEGNDSDDGMEFASPVAGDYLSPVRSPSPSASPEKSTRESDYIEGNKGVRASRRTSMSRTLEELMRHNLHL